MLKRFRNVITLLLIFGFTAGLLGDESEIVQYFPNTLGSYWVYKDQDGNELTRRAVEDEEVAEKTYHAFSYEPTVEDWAGYAYHIQPFLYQIGEEKITFSVGDEVKETIKARLTKEIETTIEKMKKTVPPGADTSSFDLNYDVKVEAQDHFHLLPIPVTFNEEWDAMEINATLTLSEPGGGDLGTGHFTISESGNVLGTETVETPAGTFEECLKIEYRTESVLLLTPPSETDPPGESVTTLWLAPNVGIVKFHQEDEGMFLNTIPQLNSSPTIKTFELTKYKIESDD
ncbi:MAG: hypothetical protein OXM61_04210 [Candidatus Poribacteria bacterium]|nr:hypothetical protein [Candidatus Poribacteria bacterium]